jgi:hypothetical protein
LGPDLPQQCHNAICEDGQKHSGVEVAFSTEILAVCLKDQHLTRFLLGKTTLKESNYTEWLKSSNSRMLELQKYYRDANY